MAREIFKQSGPQLDYVEAFFTTFDYPRLSWLHLISKKQFTAASSTFLNLARSEPALDPAKFMLSMGKLCELVEIDRAGGGVGGSVSLSREGNTSADVDEDIKVYDESLDLVDVQLKLRKDLLELISDVDITSSLQIADVGAKNEEILAKAHAIAERAATKLIAAGRMGLVSLFKRLVGNLVAGRRLGVEETMDVLTLKDNSFDLVDFTVALHLIYESQVLFILSRPILFCP